MATEEHCGPDAALMESMRAVGYSLSTAIADIIDNSIAAGARKVEVRFAGGEDPHLTIFDDGSGMSSETLRAAMRLGGHAQQHRSPTDLGRFGLGLKTASLSQCRCLTVVSKYHGAIEAVRWDLDHLATTGQWTLLVLDGQELEALPGLARLDEVPNGTLVIWTKMDRFFGAAHASGATLDAEMMDVQEHLGLVFHQFLSGDYQFPKVEMSINDRPIQPADPFLKSSTRTQLSPFQRISIGNVKIGIQAFTLPYLNKMTASERQLAGVQHGLRDTQGFYIYRAGRLVVWGTWFRLMPRTEAGKLTRVKVDVPNALDYLWSLDIKKSSAVPPHALREQLRNLAAAMVEPSERVHTFRGRKQRTEDDLARLWDLIEERDTFRYEINRDHPLMQEIQDSLDPEQIRNLQTFLRLVETTFPAQDLHNRMSRDKTVSGLRVSEDELVAKASALWRGLGERETLEMFANRIVMFEPWDLFRNRLPEFIQRLRAEGGGETT